MRSEKIPLGSMERGREGGERDRDMYIYIYIHIYIYMFSILYIFIYVYTLPGQGPKNLPHNHFGVPACTVQLRGSLKGYWTSLPVHSSSEPSPSVQ